jgi:hypothetical protein
MCAHPLLAQGFIAAFKLPVAGHQSKVEGLQLQDKQAMFMYITARQGLEASAAAAADTGCTVRLLYQVCVCKCWSLPCDCSFAA